MKYEHGIGYYPKNDEGSNPHCFIPSGFKANNYIL